MAVETKTGWGSLRRLPQALREIRKAEGETQESLGPKVGVSGNSISNYERGEVPIPADVLGRILASCGRTLHDLADAIEGLRSEDVKDLGVGFDLDRTVERMREELADAKRTIRSLTRTVDLLMDQRFEQNSGTEPGGSKPEDSKSAHRR